MEDACGAGVSRILTALDGDDQVQGHMATIQAQWAVSGVAVPLFAGFVVTAQVVTAGSDAGGERAAFFYALIGSARFNGLDPEAYLHHVPTQIAELPISRIEKLLPLHLARSLQPLRQLAA